MAIHCCTGGMMQCSFGMAPSTFVATHRTTATSYMDAGNIMDFVPIQNIPPFDPGAEAGRREAFAATAAALGVLTPMPCVPVPTGPWVTGAPTVLLDNFPALNNSSKLMCAWAGVIQFTNPGQQTEMIP